MRRWILWSLLVGLWPSLLWAEPPAASPADPVVPPASEAKAVDLTVTSEDSRNMPSQADPIAVSPVGVRLAQSDADEKAPAQNVAKAADNENLGYEISKWVLLGVGTGLAGTGVAFGVMAGQKRDDYNKKYAEEAFIDKSLRDDADQMATLATAMWISGGAVLAGSVVLFILDGLDIGEKPLDRFTIMPAPAAYPVGASVMVRY